MYRSLFVSVFLLLAVWNGVLSANERWNPSILSEQTIQKINQQTKVYHQCLDRQITTFNLKGIDSRDASNWILKQCENQLDPIRAALLNEKVPVEIANRYLLKKKHQAARKVLRFMMFAKSQQITP